MHVLIVAATPFEIAPLLEQLETEFEQSEDYQYVKNNVQVSYVVTGVGMPMTAFMLGRILDASLFNIVINMGIAGAFDRDLELGQVVNVVTERFGDIGVEEADGTFTDVFEMELIDKDSFLLRVDTSLILLQNLLIFYQRLTVSRLIKYMVSLKV